MGETILINIRYLVNVREGTEALKGEALCSLPILENAFLVIEDGRIRDFGSMEHFSPSLFPCGTVKDIREASVLPCWCDSHTHLVFAGSREQEWVARIKGMTYPEINAKGGGILQSARDIEEIREEDLYETALARLQEVIRLGTGAIEIKSGYGLSVDGELKILRVIRELKKNVPIPVKATFLGAHSFPALYQADHPAYIDLIIHRMLPVIAQEGLADYIDVFCEKGFYNLPETARICEAGIRLGLKPRLHANQLSDTGAVELGIRLNALSVDHLEIMKEESLAALASSGTIGTLLPTAAYFLKTAYPPARKMIQAGCALALASDFNPGTSPSGNMNTVVSMACIQLKMLPEEAINAATFNGACAMEIQSETGSIARGKRANLIITQKIPSLAFLPYSFGSVLIDQVLINGLPVI